ncbi:hypothetical protein TNCV_1558451 [Trichonephila clavipes]|uniref:Uncharacterized protein n=1 Tax=Trichonephila clavipes TaxID=2585209 RepID=A0A8X6RE84_TRICX|nr:hypothetical protein TNCV_1558451 [Trichonephila clavipes]
MKTGVGIPSWHVARVSKSTIVWLPETFISTLNDQPSKNVLSSKRNLSTWNDPVSGVGKKDSETVSCQFEPLQ